MSFNFVHSFDAKPSAHTICSMEVDSPTSFPGMCELDSFKAAGIEPSLIWKLAILRRLPFDPEFGAPFMQWTGWSEIVEWGHAHAARVEGKFLAIPLEYRLQNPGVVIAEVDDFTLNEETAIWLCQGLLRVLWKVRDYPGFHITVIFRDPDCLLRWLEQEPFEEVPRPLLRKLRRQLKKTSQALRTERPQ